MFAAYTRVSQLGDRTAEDLRSFELQRQAITTFAQREGIEVEWTDDELSTGSTADRQVLNAIMERIEAGDLEGLVVYRLDRLARLPARQRFELFDRIESAGGKVLSTQETLDPSTAEGRFVREMFLGMARMQWEQVRDGFARATAYSVARGVHAQVPVGYRKGPDKRLVVERSEEKMVRGAFDRRARGDSWATIARWANTTGVKPKRADQWTRRAIENIVRNRAYLGEARYGESVNPDAHEPIVTLDAWEAANVARGVRPSRGAPSMLSGVIRCAGCRHRMHAAVVGTRKQLVYRCRGHHGAGACPAPASVTRGLLDDLVRDAFLQHYADIAVEGRAGAAGLQDATDTLRAAERELAAYMETITIDDVGPEAFKAGAAKRRERVTDAERALHRARSQAAGMDLGIRGLNQLLWSQLEPMDRKRLLTAGIDAVFVRRAPVNGRKRLDPDRVHVYWRGQAPEGLPGPGVHVPIAPLDWPPSTVG